MDFIDALAAWMTTQRWYAGKGHQPRLRILDAQPGPAGSTRYLVMDDAGTLPTLYHVPLVQASSADDADVIDPRDGSALVDAARQQDFAIDTLAEMGVDVRRVTGARVLTGEQSNTSIVFEERGEPTIILKLFRTLHHGENPDVTVQRALSAAGSPYIPRFFGSKDASWPDVGREAGSAHGTLGFAQEFLPGVRDGWAIALDAAREGRDFTDAARDLAIAVAGVHGALSVTLDTADAAPDLVAATGDTWQRRLRIASNALLRAARRGG